MGAWQELPQPGRAPQVEWRAQQITDPVERLRYLRNAMKETPSPAEQVRQHWPIIALATLTLTLVLVAKLAGTHTPVSVAAHSDPQKTAAPPSAPQVTRQPPEVVLHNAEVMFNVWPVERNAAFELYSNGLRIENQYRTAGERRTFQRFSTHGPLPAHETDPAGIVFHTTESLQVPFEQKQNDRLKKVSANLMAFVQRQQAYHFVIDRFGRVYRIVEESDAANHSGNSIWADARGTYLNLNNSFLGVAFETKTQHTEGESTVSAAQLHAGRVLTEWLRSRYHIDAGNCVTHAQVSVSPISMEIGYHSDWAGNFPFRELGLPDNYDLPVPSLYTFGFGYGRHFLQNIGSRPWKGLQAADERLRREAAEHGVSLAQYRVALQQTYHTLIAARKQERASEEKSNALQ